MGLTGTIPSLSGCTDPGTRYVSERLSRRGPWEELIELCGSVWRAVTELGTSSAGPVRFENLSSEPMSESPQSESPLRTDLSDAFSEIVSGGRGGPIEFGWSSGR